MSEHPIVPNVGDEAFVKARSKRVTHTQKVRENILRTVMGTPQGREYMWDFWGMAGVLKSVFAPDPYVHAFNAGAVNLGLVTLNEVMEICPDLYQLAMSEAKTRKEGEQNV